MNAEEPPGEVMEGFGTHILRRVFLQSPDPANGQKPIACSFLFGKDRVRYCREWRHISGIANDNMPSREKLWQVISKLAEFELSTQRTGADMGLNSTIPKLRMQVAEQEEGKMTQMKTNKILQAELEKVRQQKKAKDSEVRMLRIGVMPGYGNLRGSSISSPFVKGAIQMLQGMKGLYPDDGGVNTN
eukprot:gnl/MRDRNA2_/MRDRNA2_16292_c0_seq1.p1 gnl/MRDRNA2_/MRDRNA2_16292_c0~~gnl/MRDRNA2_/MRDRNA2_16292_c0_seq1.p1  ORF type:complete len:216 (+),score=32.56 gnl/MRDRNA2_/MRDRNA2_16292_c0_seq1:89-649(+)